MTPSTNVSSALFNMSPTADDRDHLLTLYRHIRHQTEALCQPLAIEDHCIQTMSDVSPPKWHIAHVTWFFEAFVIKPRWPGYQEFEPLFDYLFNSYYETHGQPYPRSQRGLLSRPTVAEVMRYRVQVDDAMTELAYVIDEESWDTFKETVVLGLHHEQQHQELLLTDIKHILAHNPLRPTFRNSVEAPPWTRTTTTWVEGRGGLGWIGHDGEGFSFDSETPRHRVLVNDHALASRLVTNGEFLAFMDAGGYRRPELWLSEGWATVRREQWEAPLYWEKRKGDWWLMTLAGMRPVDEYEPVCHVSFYEADAYARWAGKRLPTEAELELAAAGRPIAGNFRDSGRLHPAPAPVDEPLGQIYGDVWEWTQTPYGPYPGFEPLAGSLGEYNGKFMCSQMVLRGGSCVTPASHMRASYRNFFYPGDRWQFTGIRLADDR